MAGYKLHLAEARRRGHKKGSLQARDFVDSILNELNIGADDEEDQPRLEELFEIFDAIDDAVRLPKSMKNGCQGGDLYDTEEDVIAWDDMKNRELDPKEV